MKILANVQGNAQDLFQVETSDLIGKRLTAFTSDVGLIFSLHLLALLYECWLMAPGAGRREIDHLGVSRFGLREPSSPFDGVAIL